LPSSFSHCRRAPHPAYDLHFPSHMHTDTPMALLAS
jgi:hypothetical protein